jgi:hypothetical protein
MKKIISLLYPFLFALYPIIELRNYNITYVDSASLIRPMLISILCTGLIWMVLRWLMKDWQKAGILTSLLVISFFLYGHVFIQIESNFGSAIRHRYLILIFGGLLLSAGIYIQTKMKSPGLLNFLAAVGVILILFSAIRSIQHDLSEYRSAREIRELQKSFLEETNQPNAAVKPDIYVILLDAHTSARTLQNVFGYDESSFTQQLQDLGFYVAECAQSNYPITNLSVTSMFYANYHQQPTLFPLYSSLAIETLRSQGYQVITFENRSNGHFSFAEDIRLSRNQIFQGNIDLTGGFSEFEIMLIKTSFARIAFDMPQLIPGFDAQRLQKLEYYEHYQQTFFILDELKRLPQRDGPKFVFAHLLVPHSPFIFAANGSFQWADDPVNGYISNVQFIDSQIVPAVAEIIASSDVPPVIILMGDHGPTGVPNVDTPTTRMSILNAYYVNDDTKMDLYPTITPVNSFRVVFNNYFGTSYPLLDDLSYHTGNMNGFTPDTLVKNECPQIP